MDNICILWDIENVTPGADSAFIDGLEGFSRPTDKMKALEMLMRYLSLFHDKKHITVDVPALTDEQAQALELLTRTGVL